MADSKSCGSALSHLFAVAGPAISPALGRNPCILWRPFMTVGAMGLSKLLGTTSNDAFRPTPPSRSPFRRKHLIEGKPQRRPIHDGVGFQARALCKFGGDVADPSYDRNSRLSPIALLLTARGPTAIIRKVALVVVNAINRMTCWTRTHISFEVCKTMKPAFAYRDATTSVVFKLFRSRIQASALHSLPHVVDRIGVLKRHVETLTPVALRHKRSKDNS